MKRLLHILSTALLAGLFFAASAAPVTAADVLPPEISWEMSAPDMVRFHLHFVNPDPFEYTLPVSGEMRSQQFGVFMPDFGTIGTFDIPPIEPESFFDVFFEVPLNQLPPNPPHGSGLSAYQAPLVVCPPPMWVGNVEVFWNGPGSPVNFHQGNIGVCPGGAASCLHVLTGCAGNMTWAINNQCAPGWTVTLENEDHTPAPALLPANWTGWLCVTAAANIQIWAQCCYSVDFWCNGVKATVNVCAIACPCDVGVEQNSWGRVKSIYR